ncbi:hypothetical protein Tco_0241901 [Tanacetum coccineum]
MTESPLMDSNFAAPVFSPRDDPIACLNKAMDFLTPVASLRVMLLALGETMQVDMQGLLNATTIKVKDIWLSNALSLSDQGMQHEVPNSKTYLNDMENQGVQAMQDFEQPPAAQQNSMILSVIEQMSKQMINHVNNWEKANKEQNNESVTAELERYKKRVKTFDQCLNTDLSSREKMIDSKMDDMIKEKIALKEQVDSFEQNLSKQIKEKECLLQTFTIFKSESKEKEDKYMENKIDLEKKIKELDNVIFKVGQSAKTVHMLTKPQAFYDNIHKQALGYQNPFHLKKAQWIKPTLYDGFVMSDKHVAMPVIDDEETLILEEKSRSKIKPSDALPVKIEAPKKLPKISLIKTTPNACTEDEWGFEHTKAIFNNEIIPFLKSLEDIFNMFDKDLLNEIMEVQTVFDQMDAAVQQSSVDKQCLEIAKKELPLENDRILQQIMSQDVLLTMMNSMYLIGDTVNVDGNRKESCMFKLDLEPLAPRLLQNKEMHTEYLKYTQEQANILRGIVKQAKLKQPLDIELDFACHPFTEVGFKWKPTGRTFTIAGNSCPLTRITSANVVPLKQTAFHSVETQKPELKVYNKKPKNVKNIGSSKKAKIVESKTANHSEPNPTWGSNATDIPSSSSLVMTGYPDCSLVSVLRMFETHDRESLSAHKLY